MDNPWKKLPRHPPYVLRDDGALDPGIEVESIPEPFIGNPQSATVILLNGNPGHSDRDRTAHMDPKFGKALRRNLLHKEQEYPFYPVNPEFRWTPCAEWWHKHVRELFDIGGLQPLGVAQRLCVIEWFPYHSVDAGNLPDQHICFSQDYSFDLARRALETSKLVVGMRAKTRWIGVDPRFSIIPYLKNPQNPVISRRNAGEVLFWQIVGALR